MRAVKHHKDHTTSAVSKVKIQQSLKEDNNDPQDVRRIANEKVKAIRDRCYNSSTMRYKGKECD